MPPFEQKARLCGRSEYDIDRSYARHLIDPRYIGEKIGEGAEARVYALSPDFTLDAVRGVILDPRAQGGLTSDTVDEYVLKVPRFKTLERSRSRRKLQHYTRAIEKFDPIIVNPTIIIEKSDGNGYAPLQRRLGDFEDVTPENMDMVRDQLRDFTQLHREFVAEGFYIDVIGLAGYGEMVKSLRDSSIEPIMTNMVIEQTEEGPRLQIHDISARSLYFEAGRPRLGTYIKRAMFGLERKILREHFGLDMGTFIE